MHTGRSSRAGKLWVLPVLAAVCAGADGVTLTVDPSATAGRIDGNIYGHFLEHIYRSVNGGLWGELVWNRSFEEHEGGQWAVRDGMIVQEGFGVNQRLTFGDAAWTDYEFTLEARKTGGAEGFLVLFRVMTDADFYWCNLGGWGNARHALERGRSGEQRWHVVGPQVDGAIAANRWYRIKVRCEGPRLRVWLDDALLIEFQDAQGHARGKVGVGTWDTQAQYRDLEVKALDGTVLHRGLPETVVRPRAAAHWEAFGDGEVFLDASEAFNSHVCQRIVGRGGEAGLAQKPFRIVKGETYEGSLWVRGACPAGLVVRLADGDRVLAEAALDAPAAAWAERRFTLKPSAGADDATLVVALRGAGDVRLDQVSLMPASWARAGGFRPDLLEAVKALRPPIIRWPGGCFASAYRWKDGIGPQHKRRVYPRSIWDDMDVNSFGTDEFIAFCRAVGAEPLIVVNIGTRQWNGDVPREAFVREVCDWIEYCNGPADSAWGRVRAANGHPEPYGVTIWEIDNETWHMGAPAYAEAIEVFAPAMRRADPAVILAACGSAGYDRGALEWNRAIIERCAHLFEVLSIHHYEGPDHFAGGPRAYERFFRRTAEQIAASKNPDLKIYVSEWNAQSTDWRTGLYCGGLLNAFERCGDVLTMGGPALFLRHVSATDWDNAFINFDHRTWFPAPNYVVMKLWRERYGPVRLDLAGEAGVLNASASRGEDGRALYVKVVNPSDAPVRLTLHVAGDRAVAGAAVEMVAPGSLRARNTLAAPRAVRAEAHAAQVRQQSVMVDLPAWSAAVVSVELQR